MTPPRQIKKPPRLSAAQREILKHARIMGFITPLEAGLIVHASRAQPCFRPAGITTDRACCPECVRDGRRALDRLDRRDIDVTVRSTRESVTWDRAA